VDGELQQLLQDFFADGGAEAANLRMAGSSVSCGPPKGRSGLALM